jgi:2-keto-4-pentenoate hydratase/2-oxohepta-3-ene-1,7-dioic acid hydratase in catechol pathway
MKLLRYGPAGQEKPGILDADGRIRDLSAHVADIDGAALTPDRLAKIAKIDVASLPLVEGEPRIGACVGKVGKFLCIGLNYADHAAEAGMKLPPEPVLFMKATSCIVGPNDDVVLPRTAVKGDWEVELGVVIGKKAKYVTEDEALDHVAGYCTINDVSERSFQAERAGQWTKGKSCDTFGPIGPWVVTRDEIADPQDLKLWCHVNGKPMQNGSTNTMHFGVKHIVSYLSQFFTLEPGDVIATGTPPGVGLGMKPPVFLKAGDVMDVGVEGLGTQRQRVLAD